MLNIKQIKLLVGSHSDTGTTGQGCAMNVISYLNGDDVITDDSPCVCVTIRPILIFLNDFANDEQRQRLLPFLMRSMGTATDDMAVIKNRLKHTVAYAEFNARLAVKSAKEAAKAAKLAAEYAYYAEYSSKSTKEAAKAAKLAAEYAYYAEYSSKSTKEAAKAAKLAAEYAAKAADYAKYFLNREVMFQAGLDYLDKVCNPAEPINDVIIQRANKLFELSNDKHDTPTIV